MNNFVYAGLVLIFFVLVSGRASKASEAAKKEEWAKATYYATEALAYLICLAAVVIIDAVG